MSDWSGLISGDEFVQARLAIESDKSKGLPKKDKIKALDFIRGLVKLFNALQHISVLIIGIIQMCNEAQFS